MGARKFPTQEKIAKWRAMLDRPCAKTARRHDPLAGNPTVSLLCPMGRRLGNAVLRRGACDLEQRLSKRAETRLPAQHEGNERPAYARKSDRKREHAEQRKQAWRTPPALRARGLRIHTERHACEPPRVTKSSGASTCARKKARTSAREPVSARKPDRRWWRP